MSIDPEDLFEPTDIADATRLSGEGCFAYSGEELLEILDPYGDSAADYLIDLEEYNL